MYYIIDASNGSPHKREYVLCLWYHQRSHVTCHLWCIPRDCKQNFWGVGLPLGHKTPWVREAEKRSAELRSESGLLTGTGDTSHKAQEKFFKGSEMNIKLRPDVHYYVMTWVKSPGNIIHSCPKELFHTSNFYQRLWASILK